MTTVRDSLLDLEKHRRLLEDNIQQLRKALQHWRTWDAEYEALKEEVQEVPSDIEAKELVRIRDNFEGELVDQKEIDDIFGKAQTRSKDQIINVLERRIDYVTKNLENLEKQRETAENKYGAATILSQPDATDEDGQPITDIVEELDEDDNVVSYRLEKPGESLPHVREALEKAGVKDLPELDEASVDKEVSESPAAASGTAAVAPRRSGPKAPSQQRQIPSQASTTPKKSVSFSEDTAMNDDEPIEMSLTAKRIGEIMRNAKDLETATTGAPVIPEDESPEDAAMRQEMLKYGMGEVGAVVAELEVEDGSDDEDDADEYMDWDDDDEFAEEDRYGRSTRRTVTDDYRQRMLELEQKLGIKSRFTEKAEAAEAESKDGSDSDDGGIGRIVIKRGQNAAAPAPAGPSKSSIKETSIRSTDGEKKGVRFANELDIAPDDQPNVTEPNDTKKDLIDPLSDVVERSVPAQPAETKSTRKPSRFKQSRGEAGSTDAIPMGPFDAPAKFLDPEERPTPSGPEGATIADKLVERDNTVSTPANMDDYDNSTSYQEVAGEYQKMRNKFIQRDGGFLKEDESPIQPLDQNGLGRERMSRFKAARLSRQ
jgi:unconventional prefoldin RPB5 interactor 1